MKALITVLRRDHREQDIPVLVEVSHDRDGDIWSVCAEDIEERRTTNRYGSLEEYATGHLLFRCGDPMTLEDDELAEAEAALAQLHALWAEERARLREIFAPLDRPSPVGEPDHPEEDHAE